MYIKSIYLYNIHMNKISIQNLIYNSGDIFLPENIKNILGTDLIGTSKKTFYVSGWSIIHFINGIIVGYLYLYFNYDSRFYILRLFIIHTIWECWQILIGMAKPYKLTGRSNLIDTIMDTLFFMLGAYIVRKYYLHL
jgi:hypothetical protein